MTEAVAPGGPSEAIQRALWETLTQSPAMIALYGNEDPRVWDEVPLDADNRPEGGYPYQTIGEDQTVGYEPTTDVDETTLYADVHFWDEPQDRSGKQLNKALCWAAREAVVGADAFDAFAARVAAYGFICTIGECRDARHFPTVDGLEHAVLTFRFELDPQPDP